MAGKHKSILNHILGKNCRYERQLMAQRHPYLAPSLVHSHQQYPAPTLNTIEPYYDKLKPMEVCRELEQTSDSMTKGWR